MGGGKQRRKHTRPKFGVIGKLTKYREVGLDEVEDASKPSCDIPKVEQPQVKKFYEKLEAHRLIVQKERGL